MSRDQGRGGAFESLARRLLKLRDMVIAREAEASLRRPCTSACGYVDGYNRFMATFQDMFRSFAKLNSHSSLGIVGQETPHFRIMCRCSKRIEAITKSIMLRYQVKHQKLIVTLMLGPSDHS